MTERTYKGHKVLCNCNDDFQRGQGLSVSGDLFQDKKREYPHDGPYAGQCLKCGMFHWYYRDKTYEPKEKQTT